MGKKKMNIVGLSKEINKITQTYLKDVNSTVNIVATEVAKAAQKELTQRSKDYGWKGYAKNWRIKDASTPGNVSKIIYNFKYGPLVHLLEKGHATRNGTSRTRAFPHVGPVEEKFTEIYEERMIDALSNMTK